MPSNLYQLETDTKSTPEFHPCLDNAAASLLRGFEEALRQGSLAVWVRSKVLLHALNRIGVSR